MEKIVFGVQLVHRPCVTQGTLREDPEFQRRGLCGLYTALEAGTPRSVHNPTLPPRSGSYLTGIKGLGLFPALRFCACLNPHWVRWEKIQTCA